MRNLHLEKISPKNENQQLTDLIVGTYYRKCNKNKKDFRPRDFRKALQSGRSRTGSGLYDKYAETFKDFTGITLQDFSDFSGHDLVFWIGQKSSNRQRLLTRITAEVSITESHFAVSINFNQLITSSFLISDLPRLVLVQDFEYLLGQLNEKYPEKNIFQWVSQKTGHAIDVIKAEYPNGVPFRSERNFSKKFGIGFQVFTRDHSNFGRNCRSKITTHYESLFTKYLNLECTGEWFNRDIITLSDNFRLHDELITDFICPYEYCEFSSKDKANFDKHVFSCTNTTRIDYTQEKMTDKSKVRDFLIENNFLDSQFQNKNFMVFDIESFGTKDSARDISDSTAVLSEQKIVTVAFSRNFGSPCNRTVCFKRESFSHDDYLKFFRKIGFFLKQSCLEYFRSLPSSILESITKLELKVKEFQRQSKADEPSANFDENFSRKDYFLMKSGLTYLKKLLVCKIYGFNSEKYDLPIFIPGLLSIWDLKPNQISCIKRGTGLMSVKLEVDGQEFQFDDARLYTAGGSLSDFGDTFGSETTKGTFCYEYFQSIHEAKMCTEWPELEHFKSSLSFPVTSIIEKFHSAFEYASSHMNITAQNFLEKMSISPEAYDSPSDPFELPTAIDFEKCNFQSQTLDPIIYIKGYISYMELKELNLISNMFDYLAFYNKDDVRILQSALTKYAELFIQNLDINPLDFISLPGLAERVMWTKYDNKIGAPYSIDRANLVEEIRKSRTGGIVKILTTRHVEIGVPTSERIYSDEVYTVPNGDTVAMVQSWDANNLYGQGSIERLIIIFEIFNL